MMRLLSLACEYIFPAPQYYVLIIVSSGGGRLFDEETGKMVYKSDQTFSSIPNAFTRALNLKSPVAVIAGE